MARLDLNPFVSTCIALVASVLSACDGTHTGNPGSGPEGADFVRSSLALDESPDVPDADREQLAADNQDFAFDLYAQVAPPKVGENVFMSPYSISSALAMLYAGAANETRDEMQSAIHLQLPEPELHVAFNAATQAIESRDARGELENGAETDGARVTIDNMMFADKSLDFLADYLDVLAVNYDAGVYRLDFGGNPEPARKAINMWVADKTEQRITELLPDNSIDSQTVFVLTNAVYFKAHWNEEFAKGATADGTFHAEDSDVSVRMMRGQLTKARYAEAADYQAVELQFVPTSLRMLVIMPSEGQFPAVEARFDRGLFDEIRAALAPGGVALTMPRFQMKTAFALVEPLMALGMEHAFVDADFSRMTKTTGIFISAVHHQAFVVVDEEGVEAAAATAVVGSKNAGKIVQQTVVLDRPFLIAIYDEPTGQILFMGRLEKPD